MKQGPTSCSLRTTSKISFFCIFFTRGWFSARLQNSLKLASCSLVQLSDQANAKRRHSNTQERAHKLGSITSAEDFAETASPIWGSKDPSSVHSLFVKLVKASTPQESAGWKLSRQRGVAHECGDPSQEKKEETPAADRRGHPSGQPSGEGDSRLRAATAHSLAMGPHR